MGEIFDAIYYEQQRPSSGIGKFVDEARDSFVEKAILKSGQRGRLLDIGCGVGCSLSGCRNTSRCRELRFPPPG